MGMVIPLKAKLGLGIIVGYATYTAYISIRTNLEINRRSKLFGAKAERKSNVPLKFEVLNIGGRFENPFPEYRAQSLFEFVLSRILELFEGRSRGKLPKSNEVLRELLPVYKPNFQLLFNNSDSKESEFIKNLPPLCDRLTFTWLGQSCSYFQLSNISFLTDPIFEDYIINKTIGPKRITPSPCKLNELPVPDFVMVSHNHPDHLEEASIKEIGNKSTWIVPLGLKKYLARRGIYKTLEMSWWERQPIDIKNNNNNDKYEIVCLPALHWSGRYVYDSNSSLWCSFLILKNGKSIFYHAGDTGYSKELFKEIYKIYGPTKFSMLPIGQYCPQWHQKSRHITPEEAVKIMDDMHSEKIVGVHWGTFILSSEWFLEPKVLFEKFARDLNKQDDILVPKFGETFCVDINSSSKNKEDIEIQK
ncbi:hypothetical protein PACTADRAFT_74187 [Pachysolen tannophilus NRRL Y-2460]|uniref:Metallo-beta-lactamase domain-containing protein n=1 Tax=Pachysolen tannophilus NRRL Y-2460 TaxID=669874 RepID=A0A1E4TXU6_PACTA|nr:hypothetical protein PACTADRAFT_74187 [Pachysolen tannophilus NRRL Y-2460]